MKTNKMREKYYKRRQLLGSPSVLVEEYKTFTKFTAHFDSTESAEPLLGDCAKFLHEN